MLMFLLEHFFSLLATITLIRVLCIGYASAVQRYQIVPLSRKPHETQKPYPSNL